MYRFEDDLIGQYGALGGEDFSTQMQCGVKRSVEETTPPSSTHKVRVMENGATPTTPLSSRRHTVDNSGHNGWESFHDTRNPVLNCVLFLQINP